VNKSLQLATLVIWDLMGERGRAGDLELNGWTILSYQAKQGDKSIMEMKKSSEKSMLMRCNQCSVKEG
jgi:hypothetical protein